MRYSTTYTFYSLKHICLVGWLVATDQKEKKKGICFIMIVHGTTQAHVYPEKHARITAVCISLVRIN